MLGVNAAVELRNHTFITRRVGEERAASRYFSQTYRIVATEFIDLSEQYEFNREGRRLINQYRITRRRIQIPATSITAFPSQTLYGGIAPSLPRSSVRASSG